MGVIKFNINSKIFYEDNEYLIKSYPSADKVLLKCSISPYKEIIVKVNDLIKDSKNANEAKKSQVEYGDKALDKANDAMKQRFAGNDEIDTEEFVKAYLDHLKPYILNSLNKRNMKI